MNTSKMQLMQPTLYSQEAQAKLQEKSGVSLKVEKKSIYLQNLASPTKLQSPKTNAQVVSSQSQLALNAARANALLTAVSGIEGNKVYVTKSGKDFLI